MKVLVSKVLALSGLCALFVGVGNVAFAQRYDDNGAPYRYDRQRNNDRQFENGTSGSWGTIEQERHELQVLHEVYDHEAASGHYQAAMRAHLRANAIRAHMRAQFRNMHGDRQDMNGDRWNRP